jgi:putative membrane protein
MAFSLPTIELSRFNRTFITRAALVIVAIIPAFYAGMYLASTRNPVDHLDSLPAVIVNHDVAALADGTRIDAGAELVDELTGSDESFDWSTASEDEAQAGLIDGSYFALIEIPADFSSSIASAATDDPHQAKVTVYSDDATSYIIGQVTNTVTNGIKNALNEKITAEYLDNVYLGFNDLHDSIADAADGASDLASGAAGASDGADDLVIGLGQLSSGAAELSTGTAKLSDGAAELSSGASSLASGTKTLAAKTQQLATGAAGVATAAQQLAASVPSTSPLAAPLAQLAAGAESVSTGATGIDSAIDSTLVPGTAKLATGAASVAAGASDAHVGASKLATGASTADEGGEKLANGLAKLETGSAELSDGLDDGLDDIPTYTDAERSTLADVVATPVDAERIHASAVDDYAQGLAPYFIPLALWIGGMVAFMVMRPLSPRGLASNASSFKVAVAGYLPGAFFGALQASVVLFVLEFVVGLHTAMPWWTLLFGAVVGMAFMAIHQAFVALFGGVGRLAALILLMVQLPSASGTYPVQTSPEFFQAISHWLPMTYAVQGFRQVIAGGSDAIAWSAAGALALFGLAALGLTVYAAHRNRSWSVNRLHPALSL